MLINRGSSKGDTNNFADFIRNANSKQKKRVYNVVLAEAIKQQSLVIMEAETKRA